MAYQSEIEKLKRRYDEKPEQWFAALADAHRKAGELEQAIRIVEEGIKQRPNYVSGHIVLGRCLVDQGADDRAEKVFEEVLELDAENIIALKVLGDVSERSGNRESARRWLGRLLEVDPMNDEAREMLEKVSQPESAPAIAPVNPDVPIVTQSAARAAGVASTQGKVEEEETVPIADSVPQDPELESPPFPPLNSGRTISADSTTSVRELLDAAAASSPSNNEVDDTGFVIERVKEALPSSEHDAMDLPPFEKLSESETKMVSFNGPAQSAEPNSGREEDASDLAAGTLDFVARDADEPTESVAEPVHVTDDEPVELEPFETPLEEEPLELEVQPEPVAAEPLPSADQISGDDLPEDVASIFASAPPITQLSPSDDNVETVGADDDSEQPTSEVLVPPSEIEADFLPADVQPAANEREVAAQAELESVEPVELEPPPLAEADSDLNVESEPVGHEEKEHVVPEVAHIPESEHVPLDESVADVLVDSSIVGSIATPELDPPSSLVTETMAEVYAAQGHFDQARDVYRQLLADSPGDDGLQKRLAALEERARGSTATTRDGARQKQYAASQTGGESVRSMLAELLTGTPYQAEIQSAEDVVFVTPSEPSPLEQAFGETPMAGGEPTRPATDGPSLAAVFGDDPDVGSESVVGESTQDDESPGLTYDGFYGSPDRTPSPEEHDGEGDDDDEFKAWLQSLKS